MPSFQQWLPLQKMQDCGWASRHDGSDAWPVQKWSSMEFLKDVHFFTKEKHVEYGTVSPQSSFKGGCPFAKDIAGKEILKPAYTVVSNFGFRVKL